MTDHTTMPKLSRLEVIQTGARRRWSVAEKRRIVAESESGVRQISATARRYGLSSGLLFTWRRLAREGRLGSVEPIGFAQAVIAAEASPAAAAPVGVSRIEIVLANGHRLVVEATIEPGAVARIVGALERR